MGNLIQQYNEDSDPRNSGGVEVPNINVRMAEEDEFDALSQAMSQERGQQQTRQTAQEMADTPMGQALSPEGLPVPGPMPALGTQTIVDNARQQLQSEYDWRRSMLRNQPRVQYYKTAIGTPWETSVPNRILPEVEEREPDRQVIQSITGINPRPLSNAFTQGGVMQNREGERGFSRDDLPDNIWGSILGNVGGLLGTGALASEGIADATLGRLYDNTLGRVIHGGREESTEARARFEERYNPFERIERPLEELAASYLVPDEDNQSVNFREGNFGQYGSGLPGAVIAGMDYIGNATRATGTAVYDTYQTIRHAQRGEDYEYNPLNTLRSGLTMEEIYSFQEDDSVSRLSLQRFAPDEADTSGGAILRRWVAGGAGMALDLLTEGPGEALTGLVVRGARETAQDAAARAARRQLTPRPDAPRISGNGPRALLPGGDPIPYSGPSRPDIDERVAVPRPNMPDINGGGAATPDYEALFISPDGVSLEMPSNMVRDWNDITRASDEFAADDFRIPVDADQLLRDDLDRFGLDPRRPDELTPEELDERGQWYRDMFQRADDIETEANRRDLEGTFRRSSDEPDGAEGTNTPDEGVTPADEAADGVSDDISIEDLDASEQMLRDSAERLGVSDRVDWGDDVNVEDQVARTIRDLNEAADGEAITMAELRETEVMSRLSREEQDRVLHALEEEGRIEFNTLQDVTQYTDEQIAQGIDETVRVPGIDDEGQPTIKFYVTATDDEMARRLDGVGDDVDDAVRRPGKKADELLDEANDNPSILREPGAQEHILRRAADDDVLDVADNVVRRTDDVIESAQKRLISNRLEYEQLRKQAEPNEGMLRALQDEFTALRRVIAGRDPKPIVADKVDEVVPVIEQQTLRPPMDPSQLYQWTKNLPEGARIYKADAEIVTRSNGDLTALARFMGHYDGPRKRPLSADQLSSLRQQYGRMYAPNGPAIDRKALDHYGKTGMVRVETELPDEITGKPRGSRVVRQYTDKNVTRQADVNEGFTQSELSSMDTDEIQRLLDNEFSNKNVYRNGVRDPSLGRIRANLMDEMRYRDGVELTPDVSDADVEDYVDRMGLDVDELDEDAFAEMAERAAIEAEYKQDVNVEARREAMPDEMNKATSLEGDAAIREVAAAERAVTDEMVVVRDLVHVLSELDKNIAADAERLSRMPNVGDQPLRVGEHGNLRQGQVDELVRQYKAPERRLPRSDKARERARLREKGEFIKQYTADETPLTYNDLVGLVSREEPARVRLQNGRVALFTNGTRMSRGVQMFEVIDELTDTSRWYSADLITARVPDNKPATPLEDLWRERLNAQLAEREAKRTATTGRFYLGTRADFEDLADFDGTRFNRTRQPLGAGTYFYENHKAALDEANATVPQNAVGGYPIRQRGRVFEVTLDDVETVWDASTQLVDNEEIMAGVREILKNRIEDKRLYANARSALRRKDLPGLYDYLGEKLRNGRRDWSPVNEQLMYQIQLDISTYLKSQGYDAVVHSTPEGRIVNVLPGGETPRVGTVTEVGDDNLLTQAVANVNSARRDANAFGTKHANHNALAATVRFGRELRNQIVGRLKEASDGVDRALNRLDEADERLRAISETDAKAAEAARKVEAQDKFDDFLKRYNDYDEGCL